jgi:RNA polymerase sigma factor (sigma-70 family)
MEVSAETLSQLGEERPRLVRLCASILQDAHEAEDLVQQVLLKALTREGLDTGRPLGPWLRKVARNLALDRLRRARHEVPAEFPAELPCEPTQVLARDATAAWLTVLCSLKPRARAILLMRDLLDLSTEETAEALGLTPSNVRVSLHRARGALAQTAERDASARRARELREMGKLLDTPLTGGASTPAVLLGGEHGQAGWALWASLTGAALDVAHGDLRLSLNARIARIHTMLSDPDFAMDHAIAVARREAEQLDDPHMTSKLELIVADVMTSLGRLNDAEDALRTVVDLDALDARAVGYVWLSVASVHWRRGRYERAREAYDRAAACQDDPALAAAVQHNRALLESMGGDTDVAIAQLRETLTFHEDAQRTPAVRRAYNSLGMALQNAGRLDEATEAFETAIALASRAPGSVVGVRTNLALVWLERGAVTRAAAAFEQIARDAHTERVVQSVNIARGNLGVARHLAGDLAGAREALAAAERGARAQEAGALLSFVLAHRAVIDARLGEPWSVQEAHDLASEIPRLDRVVTALEATCLLLTDRDEQALATLQGLVAEAGRFAALRIALQVADDVARTRGLRVAAWT